MAFPLHYDKSFQAMAKLIRLPRSKTMGVWWLLKLLYVADRTSLEERGRPILGGRLVAMQAGPLHSTLYDLIVGCDPESPEWRKHFDRTGNDLSVVDDPGNDKLSRYEVELLERVFQRFDAGQEDLGDYVHSLPEFLKNHAGTSSKTIPLEDVIDGAGLTESREAILREAKTVQTFDRLFR